MVTIGPAKVSQEKNGWWSAERTVSAGASRYDIRYRISKGPVAGGPEPFIPSALLCVMRRGELLRIAEPVSKTLLANLRAIQEMFCSWSREFRIVPVEAPVASSSDPVTPSRASGSFFSGGVDSSYTALKHREEIDALIFVHGFDVRLQDAALRAVIASSLRQAAVALGKAFIEVETNVRELTDSVASWGDYAHGPALAGVALALSHRLARIYIPATYTYRSQIPNGSHPLLDPLWGTESVEIIHDGCEATRIEKIQQIVKHEIIRKTLRVCWENRHGTYNCGECEKCLRTMADLRVAGARDEVTTFSRPLSLARLSRLRLADPHKRVLMEETYEVVRLTGQDPALARALRNALGGVQDQGLRGWPRRTVTRLCRLVS